MDLSSYLTALSVQHIVVAADEIPQNIEFTHEMHGHHHGQSDMRLVARVSGQVVGTLDYTVFNDTPAISYVSVPVEFRRKGYGTKLIKELQREFTGTPINFGGLTGDGAELYKSLPKQVVQTSNVAALRAEISEINAKLSHYEKLAEAYRNSEHTDAAYKEFTEAVSDWNELSDRRDELEQEIELDQGDRYLISTAAEDIPETIDVGGIRVACV